VAGKAAAVSSSTLTLATAVLLAAGGGGGVATLVSVPFNRRRLAASANRDAAEAVQLLTTSSVAAVSKLQEQLEHVGEMRAQLTSLRLQLNEAEEKTRQLIVDLDAANARARTAEEQLARLRDEVARRRAKRHPPDEVAGA
jgi:predicted  nucleic acid-binding Zn-ribbon protein